MRTIQRLAVVGFFVGQQLQQPIELSLISQRIAFRLSYQPSTVRKVLFVVVALYCELQGYMGWSAGCAYSAELSSKSESG